MSVLRGSREIRTPLGNVALDEVRRSLRAREIEVRRRVARYGNDAWVPRGYVPLDQLTAREVLTAAVSIACGRRRCELRGAFLEALRSARAEYARIMEERRRIEGTTEIPEDDTLMNRLMEESGAVRRQELFDAFEEWRLANGEDIWNRITRLSSEDPFWRRVVVRPVFLDNNMDNNTENNMDNNDTGSIGMGEEQIPDLEFAVVEDGERGLWAGERIQ